MEHGLILRKGDKKVVIGLREYNQDQKCFIDMDRCPFTEKMIGVACTECQYRGSPVSFVRSSEPGTEMVRAACLYPEGKS